MKRVLATPKEDKFRVPFRVALSAVFMALLIGTVATTGILSYRNLVRNTDQLSSQVLDQTSRRIESRVGNLLSRANDQSQLNRSLLGEIRPGPENFPRRGVFWWRIMESHPYFTSLSVSLETGESLSIDRLKDGSLTIRESRLDRRGNILTHSDFRPEDHRAGSYYHRRAVRFDRWQGVPSWYSNATEAGQPVWIAARSTGVDSCRL